MAKKWIASAVMRPSMRRGMGMMRGGQLPPLAAAVDRAHREHAGKPHPKTLQFHGVTFRLGGK